MLFQPSQYDILDFCIEGSDTLWTGRAKWEGLTTHTHSRLQIDHNSNVQDLVDAPIFGAFIAIRNKCFCIHIVGAVLLLRYR